MLTVLLRSDALEQVLLVLGVVGVWLLLQLVILPRLGVPT